VARLALAGKHLIRTIEDLEGIVPLREAEKKS